jgi:hypothetical protein
MISAGTAPRHDFAIKPEFGESLGFPVISWHESGRRSDSVQMQAGAAARARLVRSMPGDSIPPVHECRWANVVK